MTKVRKALLELGFYGLVLGVLLFSACSLWGQPPQSVLPVKSPELPPQSIFGGKPGQTSPRPPIAQPAQSQSHLNGNAVSPRRVQINGYWWDEYPDGTLKWCEPCNGKFPGGEKVFSSWKGPSSRATQAVPAVTAAPTFRPAGISYNRSHNCPSCGRAQYEVSGSGPVAGTHSHTCSWCGRVWYH